MMKNNCIHLRDIEDKLYCIVDAGGMRGNYTYKGSFDLGGNHLMDIKITNFLKDKLSNNYLVNVGKCVIGINFRKRGLKKPWFRVDNESRDKNRGKKCLHFHLDLENKKFEEHQEIKGNYSVASIISEVFDSIPTIVSKKFPAELIKDGNGFVGTA